MSVSPMFRSIATDALIDVMFRGLAYKENAADLFHEHATPGLIECSRFAQYGRLQEGRCNFAS